MTERRRRNTRNTLAAITVLVIGSIYMLVISDVGRIKLIDQDENSTEIQTNFYFKHINSRQYSETGHIIREIVAPFASEISNNGFTQILDVTLHVHSRDNNLWKISGKQAILDPTGNLLQMPENVNLRNEANDIQIDTRNLNVNVLQKLFSTSEKTTIKTDGSLTEGIGFRGDLNTKTFVLLNNVRGSYDISAEK